ncbi:MAG: sigma-70 family RNA polymerase sigma factor [Eubacteriales bacterium]|jgi:RNA polymerase sigma factor (sigma-70 family)|nr:sigma-70 family RNA polymerase sigma factor [Clostridiales bacterium]HOQ13700.1 sigma-70 family RNA polymerase sigma factor [Bacillota bacterium]
MVDQNITHQFNEIYSDTWKTVLSYVTSKCSNTADIHDIVQDTYVELYKIMEKRGADYIKNPHALALRIAKQKVSRHYSLISRLRMFLPLAVSAGDDSEDNANLLEFEADDFLTEDFVVDRIVLEEVKRILFQKPQDVKKVFYLFYEVGLTIPEIAKALSMSESNVKHKLYRTLGELRALLK